MYNSQLNGWAVSHDVQLPYIPEECQQSFHMFYMLLPSLELRDRLILHLKQQGISAVFHYLPLDSSDMGRKTSGSVQQGCPVTADVSDRLVRLPLFHDLNVDQQGRVVEAVTNFKM